MDSTAPGGRASARGRWWFTLGALSLALLMVNGAVLVWILRVVGDGVDAGLGAFAGIVTITVPLGVISAVMGVIAVVGKSGRLCGWVTVGATAAALLGSVWGFLSTQVF